MSTELANGAEIEQLSSGRGDTEVPEAEKPLLHSEQAGVKVENCENEPPESGVRDNAPESASLADVNPHLTPTGEAEFEQLSSDHGHSEVSESHSEQADVKVENYENEPPESGVRDNAPESASLADVKPHLDLVPTGETEFEQLSSDHGHSEVSESHSQQADVVKVENYENENISLADVKPHLTPAGEAEFEQLSSDHGDSEIPGTDKPLLHNGQPDFVTADSYETEPHESDVESTSLEDVKPHLTPTSEVEFEQLSSDQPLLHIEQADICKVEYYESELPESDIRDTALQSAGPADDKPHLSPTGKEEFEQLSSVHGDSEESEADKPLLHIEQANVCKVEYYESELPESDVRDTALQSADPADDKPHLSPTGKEEFEQLSSVHGESEESEADKPLLYSELTDICKVESYGSELLESDVGVTAPLSALSLIHI